MVLIALDLSAICDKKNHFILQYGVQVVNLQ